MTGPFCCSPDLTVCDSFGFSSGLRKTQRPRTSHSESSPKNRITDAAVRRVHEGLEFRLDACRPGGARHHVERLYTYYVEVNRPTRNNSYPGHSSFTINIILSKSDESFGNTLRVAGRRVDKTRQAWRPGIPAKTAGRVHTDSRIGREHYSSCARLTTV